jgi:hypothetical protein
VTGTATAAVLLGIGGESIALVTAVIAAIAAAISTCIAAWQGILMKRSERNRTQPIVVAYERGDPRDQGDALVFAVSLANEGSGPAFNVSFGVTLDGVEYAYRPRPAGGQATGDVPRALGPGRTLPEDTVAYPLVLSDVTAAARTALESRLYWCRYENAFGDGWKTRNAWQPAVELEIDPVRARPRLGALRAQLRKRKQGV